MSKKRVGFISFRFAGTDGVSLEAKKWAEILTEMGYLCYFMGGELDTPSESSFLTEILHFQHPDVRRLYLDCFSRSRRSSALTEKIYALKEMVKNQIYRFIDKFKIDLLLPQNTLAIPLHVPLAIALTEIIAETEIPTVAHHHDFFWERKRFLCNCVWDYLNASYPPHLNTIQHVVINSSAKNQLAMRRGVSSVLIPNIMRFETPPSPPDEYTSDIRQSLGLEEDELLILQPTRVVQRKGIEHSIELVARLERKAALVISHASGDEGYEYQSRVREYADLMGIKAVFVQDIIADKRGITSDGRKIYTLHDIYPCADLVTYPSISEGFGNAFLEAILFKKPLLVNNYSIYSFDIRPKKFQVIEIDDFITSATVKEVQELLVDKRELERRAEVNYRLGLKYYSYRVARRSLEGILDQLTGFTDP